MLLPQKITQKFPNMKKIIFLGNFPKLKEKNGGNYIATAQQKLHRYHVYTIIRGRRYEAFFWSYLQIQLQL